MEQSFRHRNRKKKEHRHTSHKGQVLEQHKELEQQPLLELHKELEPHMVQGLEQHKVLEPELHNRKVLELERRMELVQLSRIRHHIRRRQRDCLSSHEGEPTIHHRLNHNRNLSRRLGSQRHRKSVRMCHPGMCGYHSNLKCRC